VALEELRVVKAQRALADELWKAGVLIVVGVTGSAHGPVEVEATLAAAAVAVLALRTELDPDQFAAAFDRFWTERSSRYRPAFERGIEPTVLRDFLWRWACTGESPSPALTGDGPERALRVAD
jgi:hypothetical protein